MRIDLALQGFHARLQQQTLLLLEFHLDANIVQHFQRDCYGHDGSGVDREFYQPVVAVECEYTARKRAMHLDARELESKNQQEERRLPVDEGLSTLRRIQW